jgi:hypothetical protein
VSRGPFSRLNSIEPITNELWDFREILRAIAEACQGSRFYFADDTLRTIHLLQKSGGRKRLATSHEPKSSSFLANT